MTYLRTFAPWIVYAVIAGDSVGSKRWGALAALALLASLTPRSALLGYGAALSSAALAVIAWGSLALRRPFTLGIARQSTPQQFWDRPEFWRANVVITLVWAISFTAGGAALAVVEYLGGGSIGRTVIQVLAFAIPMAFTVPYRRAVRAARRRAQARAEAPTVSCDRPR